MNAAILSLAMLVGMPAGSDPPFGDLVRQLGSKSFRVREAAAKELLARGSASLPALTAGTNDEDAEVRERCRQLLPQAAGKEREEKLAVLLAGKPVPAGLPGVERFLKVVGDTPDGRGLYAKMLGLHHEIVGLAESDPLKAGAKYRQFCDEVYTSYIGAARAGRVASVAAISSHADAAFFLFISSDARVRKNEGLNVRSSFVFNAPLFNAIVTGKADDSLRKLFLHWLENEPQSAALQRGFLLASNAGMKEALPVALRMLGRKDIPNPTQRAQILVSVARLGGKENLKDVAALLSDTTSVGNINFGNGQLTIQMRDVAMGVSVLLSGQNMVDYHFDNRFGGSPPTSYMYFGFPNDETREKAHAKWKAWAKDPKPPATKGESGPVPREKK